MYLTILDEIKINSPDEPGLAKIIAFTNWGILRGMESFSQLVTTDTSPDENTFVRYRINFIQIKLVGNFLILRSSFGKSANSHNNKIV